MKDRQGDLPAKEKTALVFRGVSKGPLNGVLFKAAELTHDAWRASTARMV